MTNRPNPALVLAPPSKLFMSKKRSSQKSIERDENDLSVARESASGEHGRLRTFKHHVCDQSGPVWATLKPALKPRVEANNEAYLDQMSPTRPRRASLAFLYIKVINHSQLVAGACSSRKHGTSAPVCPRPGARDGASVSVGLRENTIIP